MNTHVRRALASLAERNFRLYFAGQSVSVSGNWMQQIALAWLVLNLTGSALSLGISTALQSAGYLLVAGSGGVLADRLPKRRLLLCTQLAQVGPPLALWALVEFGNVRIWMVYPLLLARGLINSVDNPARQSFVTELVSRDRLVNAVSLNATISQAGRLVGPAVAAAVIARFGLGPCFLLNALSFVFMIVMLLCMRSSELNPSPVVRAARGQLRAGLSYVVRTPGLRLPLGLMAIVGLLSFNFAVVLPAVARFSFHGNATTYALMMNVLAAGALVGALVAGTRTIVSLRLVSIAAVAFGTMLGLTALAMNLPLALLALVGVGAASITFSASVQATLQLTAAPEMRGRVIALYQMVYMGTTPLGAVIVGAAAGSLGARSGLVVGAIGGISAGIYGLWSSRRIAGGAGTGHARA